METINTIINYIASLNLLGQNGVAMILCFVISYISGFINVTFHFKDRLKFLFFAWEVQCYSLFSGAFALFAFELVKIVDLSVAGINLNEKPLFMAVIVGIGGFQIFMSFFKSNSTLDNSIKGDFNNFFDRIQKFLFRSYAIRRNEIIQKEVTPFMTGFPPEKLNEIYLSSQILVKDIDEDDCEALIETISEIMSCEISGDRKTISVGVALSKVLGVEIIESIANQLKDDENLENSIESAEKMLRQIEETLVGED